MGVTEIQAGKNGPYRMAAGVVVLVHEDGTEERVERPRMSLCRCGHSQTKPICDGTHKTIGFIAEEVMIRWVDEGQGKP